EGTVDRVLRALTTNPDANVSPSVGDTQLVDAPPDIDEFQGWLMERGWGDGLPAIPPTRERIARMLAVTRRRADEVAAILVPRLGRAAPQVIPAHARLAGAVAPRPSSRPAAPGS